MTVVGVQCSSQASAGNRRFHGRPTSMEILCKGSSRYPWVTFKVEAQLSSGRGRSSSTPVSPT